VTAAPGEARPGRPRALVKLVLKLAVGAAVIAAVVSKIEIVDTVALEDGTEVRGQIQPGARQSWAIAGVTPDGRRRTFPFRDGPTLFLRGEEARIDTAKEGSFAVTDAGFEGEVTIVD
jgi:hypothetical protein